MDIKEHVRKKINRLRRIYDISCKNKSHAEALKLDGAIFHLESLFDSIHFNQFINKKCNINKEKLTEVADYYALEFIQCHTKYAVDSIPHLTLREMFIRFYDDKRL